MPSMVEDPREESVRMALLEGMRFPPIEGKLNGTSVGPKIANISASQMNW